MRVRECKRRKVVRQALRRYNCCSADKSIVFLHLLKKLPCLTPQRSDLLRSCTIVYRGRHCRRRLHPRRRGSRLELLRKVVTPETHYVIWLGAKNLAHEVFEHGLEAIGHSHVFCGIARHLILMVYVPRETQYLALARRLPLPASSPSFVNSASGTQGCNDLLREGEY